MNKCILIIKEGLPTQFDPYDGIFVQEQAIALAKRANVMVMAPVNYPLPLSPRLVHRIERKNAKEIPQFKKIQNLSVLRPKYYGLPWYLDLLNVYSMFLAILHKVQTGKIKIDIVHGHPLYRGGYVALLLGRVLKKPVVITEHGFCTNVFLRAEPFDIYGDRARKMYSPVISKYVLEVLRHADLIITVSDELATKIREKKITPRRMVTIRNGVDIDKFKLGKKDRARKQLDLPIDAKIILFVGNLDPPKRPNQLIESVSVLMQEMEEKIILIMIGDGLLKNKIERIVVRNNLESSVFVLGKKPSSEIPIWMNACDLLVLPSLYESFGCVVLEALACGKPVITSKVGGIPEYFKNGEHGLLVNPDHPRELIDAIRWVLNTRWSANRLAAFARQNSWNVIAEQLCKEYNRLLGV